MHRFKNKAIYVYGTLAQCWGSVEASLNQTSQLSLTYDIPITIQSDLQQTALNNGYTLLGIMCKEAYR